MCISFVFFFLKIVQKSLNNNNEEKEKNQPTQIPMEVRKYAELFEIKKKFKFI